MSEAFESGNETRRSPGGEPTGSSPGFVVSVFYGVWRKRVNVPTQWCRRTDVTDLNGRTTQVLGRVGDSMTRRLQTNRSQDNFGGFCFEITGVATWPAACS